MSKKLLGVGVALALVATVLVGVGAQTASAQSVNCSNIDSMLTALGITGASATQAKVAFGCGSAMTTTGYNFTKDLTMGSTGADVTALQQALIGAGYTIPAGATGYFGSQTQDAVIAYQKAKGITPAAGYVGPVTRASLNANANTTPGPVVPGTVVCPVGYTCTSTTPVSGDLEGGAGDISVSTSTTDIEDTILEGDTEKVLGFKIEATDSDVQIKNIKVTLENDNATGSPRLSRYADEVSVYMGSTMVGSADVSDFTKTGDVYSKSITLSDAVVREGSSKKASFSVQVSALSNIDSDDIDNNDWNVKISNMRFVDATGSVISDTSEVSNNFEFSDLSTSGDVTLTVSKGTGSPSADNVGVSDSGSTSDVLMLEFKLKAKGSDLSFDTLDVSVATTTGTSTLAAILGELSLENGNNELANTSTFDADGAQTVSFDLDDTFTVAAGETETFRVLAKINDIDNFISGAGLVVSFADVDAEDENGDVVTEGGSATGETQTFVIDVPTVSVVGAPELKVYTVKDSEADLYRALISFNVTAPDSNDVFLPLDTFTYGTSGTAGVEYTITGGATTTSAALVYAGSNDIEEDNSYRVSAGETEKFNFSVYLTANDAQGKITITSIWYEEADGVPSGSPEITTGLTNLKTPLVLLAQ